MLASFHGARFIHDRRNVELATDRQDDRERGWEDEGIDVDFKRAIGSLD